MDKKDRKMGMVMSVIISCAMGVLAAFLVTKTNPDATKATPVVMLYLSNILMSVITGILVALFIPLGKMGRDLAARLHANPPGVKFFLINALPLSVGNTLIISIVVSFFGILMGRAGAPADANLPPFIVMWGTSWIKLILPTLILSYVLAVILSPVLSRAMGLGGPRK